MAKDKSNTLAELKTNAGRLLHRYKEATDERNRLEIRLKAVDAELANARSRIKELESEIRGMKVAMVVSGSDSASDISEYQKRLSKMVREIDNCIALLNNS